ncbi:MAG TPA: selenouridine synthase SelU-like subunit [Methanothermococcus okinawensis]|uniref:Selenouridine synthase SelU-like subunit n=1 Tax=Methanothermococcus okinawensis TaxID=155863 RepID=A0A832YTV4_9EURY|nr:selenouridine synthase SelU-like subunit [Methanothermococcus okinawensis]
MIIFGLFGKTGSGKTEILEKLKKDHPVINIEKIARTRGSVLGDLYHRKMSNQEEFNIKINEKIEESKDIGYLIVEYEGRRIGGIKKLNIPPLLAELKNYNYKILIDCPYEHQINRLVSWYKPENKEEKNLLLERLELLKNSFKNKNMVEKIEKIIKMVQEEEYYKAAKLIEEGVYRNHYNRSLKKIKPDLIINNVDTDESVKLINDFIMEKLKKVNVSER